MNNRVLYLSYDGMLEPLGESQVLRYLERLSISNKIILISFEKYADWQQIEKRETFRAEVQMAGVIWIPLRYHNRPNILATAYDIFRGFWLGVWIVLKYRVRIVHARSYVPSIIALALKKLFYLRFIFDMRGFWADERVDGGLWSRDGHLYNLAKWFERRFLIRADHVVSLTYSAVRIMKKFSYLQSRLPVFTVIPTCVDLRRFKFHNDRLREEPFVLGYLGSVGSRYMFHKVAEAFAVLLRLRPNARLLVVNRGGHAYIYQHLQKAAVPQSLVEVTSVPHSEVPTLIARMHAGIFFYKPAFSNAATAPTKLGEFLGCGIPCLSNVGVGDMAELLQREGVGIAIESFDEDSLYQGLSQLLSLCADPEVSERCVAAAQRNFSLDEGVARYERIYKSLGA